MVSITHRHQLMDAFWDIQDREGYVSESHIASLAKQLNVSKIEIEGVLSFYHFYERQPAAKFTIYLNNSIVSKFSGFNKVKTAFEQATGILLGQRDNSGLFALREASCIGLSDMEPAALINFYPFTHLTPQKVHQLIVDLRAGKALEELCDHPDSVVQYKPELDKVVYLRPHLMGAGLQPLKSLSPTEVIQKMKDAHLTGMGGAFFPVSIKWEACRKQVAESKYVICNADEGEPGTFKDRVLLQHYPGLMLEGMIICGYAIGAQEGIIYLRAEYRYLQDKIKEVIEAYRRNNWLGKDIMGIEGFDFDIRVQLGAGAYVCGEETALMQSMEGYRGEPRPKMYLPVARGFLGQPTVVNNVETLCGAARVIELGPECIRNTGTAGSPGTKLISISGDCGRPGIYEIEWGMTVQELLNLCEADRPMAVQVSGPSGEMITSAEFGRELSLNDLRCGGSFMIFNEERNILDIILNFNQFFIEESCGVCTPCRAGNFILGRQLNKIQRSLLDQSDIMEIKNWGEIMRHSSRCGLGKTAANTIIQAFEKFPTFFEKYVAPESGLNSSFNLKEATREYDAIIQKNQEL
jgi:[NiFe] hydrogenase diaphorase moiety large subunit